MNFLDNILVPLLTSFGITFFAIPPIINVCKEKKLFDVPCGRKTHKQPTPTLGGLAIFAGFSFSLIFWSPNTLSSELKYIICSSLVIFFMGMKDDLVEISANKKIIGQIFSALIITLLADIRLTSLYGIFGVHEIPYLASVILTVFTIIVITNSFNLIDGVDGLASSMGIVSTILFGSWFYLSGHTAYSITAFCLTGSLFAFLYFNKCPAKIFMGDTGSLLIGLISSILAIRFIEVNRDYQGNPSYQLFSVPAVAISVLIIPLFDTVQVFTRRIFKGRSPFSPDKTHLHHMLSSLRIKPNYICLSLASINLTVFVGAMIFQKQIAEIIVLSILSIMLLLLLIVIKFSNLTPKRD